MRTATIRVPVATLWSSPDRVRPLDKPAFHGDVRGWVGAMTLDEREDLGGRTESQLLLGEPVLVDSVDGDFARVIAIRQSAPRKDPRGYPGWVNVEHLDYADRLPENEPTHVVAVAHTSIVDRPHGLIVHADVVLGTEITVAGPPVDGYLPLAPVDHAGVSGGYVPAASVVVRPTRPPSGAELLATATQMLGTPYVWGGLSPFGIDCSGLVHLTSRRLGVAVPRNADDQADASTPLEFGDERAGDVYFFQRPRRRVHHVGFVAAAPDPDGTRHMLHACGTSRGVVREPMTPDRVDTLVGVHRLG
jgi:cell wall-associated NlpC family hydrolase